MSRREKILAIVVALAVGIVALDWYVLSPVLQAYADLHERQDAVLANLQQARRLMRDQRAVGERWKQMEAAGLLTDASQAESQLLHAVRTWSRQAGLTLASVQPERAAAGTHLREITFQTNATGTISAVTRFLHSIQTATLPVRVRRLRIAAVDGREQLTVEMRLSTAYYEPAADQRAPAADRAAAAHPLGGNFAMVGQSPAIFAAMMLGLQADGVFELEDDAPPADDAMPTQSVDNGVEPTPSEEPTPPAPPEVAPEVTPEVAPEVTPEVTAEVTPEVTREVTAEATTEVPPEAPSAVPGSIFPGARPVSPAPTPSVSPAPAAQPAPSTRTSTRQRSSSSTSERPASSNRSADDEELTPAVRDSDNWNQYRAIVDRNIFNRNRQAPKVVVAPTPREVTAEAPPTVAVEPTDSARLFVLRGISDIDGQMHAFFEHTVDHSYRQVQVDDAIENRTITAINLDSVELQFADQSLTIKIGSTLVGDSAQPIQRTAAPSSDATAPPSANPALNWIEERMRQRRLQESQR